LLKPDESPYYRSLGNGLAIRTATDARAVERVAQSLGIVFDPSIPPMTRSLFLHHPGTSGRDLIFVEDEHTGQVVSSICLIPWTWDYEGAAIPAGELGIVGTLPDYRRRGLIREQVTFFKQRLKERGCLLSHIQGIPYYYRQFGYEYALPLEGGLRLESKEVPKPDSAPFTFRLATGDDLPTLMRLYDDAARDLSIRVVRNEAIWRYLLDHTSGSEMECESWVVEDGEKQIAGYLRLPASHFGQELAINEVSRLSAAAALAVLNHLRLLAEQRGKPGIRLNVPENCSLMRLARRLTDREYGTYSWQIHVPDMAALLRALSPVLERRVAASPFAGLTQDVEIGLYRETIALRFAQGRLAEVVNLGFKERGAITVPPLQFIPLVLGYRTLEEQRRAYPDVGVSPSQRLLVETLFPKATSFIYTIY
jgi:predicted N-acetyltransferase YhbS